jgi:uncharacterized damage-inducible protein DinB
MGARGGATEQENIVPETAATALDLYPGWETYQTRLIQALEPLTEQQLRLRTADGLRGVGETCRHIIGARARWCRYVLGLGDQTTEGLANWDDRAMPERSAAELVAGLRSSWEVLRTALTRWTANDLAVLIPNNHPSKEEPAEFSRAWVIWHLIEHDLHHSGEITEILGAHGLPGVDL